MNEEELRGLQERVLAIQQMAEGNGWYYACDRMKAQIFNHQKRILQGLAKDYETYREWVAYTDGLSFALNLPDTVQEELEREMQARLEESENGSRR